MDQNTSTAFAAAPAVPIADEAGSNGIGSALFVINLCASMAPIATTAKTLPGLENYRLYQVARAEDGRTRHRLRLGFFASEADAEQTLATVRDQYPTAFTACLSDEDRKFTRGFVPDNTPAVVRPQMTMVVDNDSTRPLKTLPPVATAAGQPTVPASPAAKSASATHVKATSAAPAIATDKTALSESIEVEITWEPPTPSTAPNVETPKGQSETTAAASNAAAIAAPVATAPVQTIKPVVHAAAATASPPPAVVTPPKAVATSAASAPTPVAKAVSLELDTSSGPMPALATPSHRGVVTAKAPALDSIQLTLDNEASTAKPVVKSTAAATQPFHVGKGVELPPTTLSLDAETASSGSPTATRTAVKHATPAARSSEHDVTASKNAQPRPAFSQTDLDSTQTIRALTAEELNDESQEKCFAIQLAVSEQPVNLDAMPHLDIFEAYRLYSIATAGSGKITHSLRIGFFKEEVSAEAVSGYLRTFFPSPTIVRISLAEQARFKDAPPARPEASQHSERDAGKVVALNDARTRNTRPAIPTVTMEVAAPVTSDTSATGSFKPNATGSFKTSAMGSFKPGATGAHKAFKPAAKSAATPTKRSQPVAASKKSATGKHPTLTKKPLSQQLLDEAREVELSESGVIKLGKSGSLLSRLVGKLSK